MLPKLSAMLEAQVVKPGPITVVHGEIHMQGYLLANGHFCTTMCCAALDRGKCSDNNISKLSSFIDSSYRR